IRTWLYPDGPVTSPSTNNPGRTSGDPTCGGGCERGQFTDRAEPRVHSRLLGRGSLALSMIAGFKHSRHPRLCWLSCADESRLKPRLGPAAEAALRPRQFTDRAEPRVHSRLLGRGSPAFEPP